MFVLDRIREFAKASPDALALIDNGRPCTYAELALGVAAWRQAFLAQGLAPGGVVVAAMRDVGMGWRANLALRSLGHTTLALRLNQRVDGLERLDVRAVVTLAGEAAPVGVAEIAAPRLTIDPTTLPTATDLPASDIVPGGHIFLTSGTTGRARMVPFDAAREAGAIEGARQSLEGYLETHDGPVRSHVFDFGLESGVGYGFGVGLWSQGVCMVVHEGVGTHASLDTPGLTHAVVTPALLEGLMAAPEGAFARNDGLILSIVGGALSEALFDKVKARLTDNIRTSVGSTEGGGSTRTDVKTVEDLHWHKLTETSTLEVVGEDDQPLPPGQVGQVRVRQVEGVGAYLGDVDASAASFRDGYFYPGDLAVMDGQGRIRILGRIGDALNLRGDKLPAAPIEEAMQQALGCQCVCFSAHDASNADELHVVLETASPPDEARLTQAARAHGSGFPTARFHFVPQFPRTGTGKVERYRLREMIAAPRPA